MTAEWMERHQVALYVVALAVGAAAGLLYPPLATGAGVAVTPLLGLLLYVTFLGVPVTGLGRAVRDVRFLVTLAAVNFVVVPIVVFFVSRVVAHDQALLVGVLFVLLTPCVDYVIVFTGLAGGAKDRLLAASPLLMIGQMVLLPGYLWLFLGDGFIGAVDLEPFVAAFILLIALPLLAAGLTQLLARRTRVGAAFASGAAAATVPLMMLTLAAVVVSQIAGVGREIAGLIWAVPVFLLFAALMVPVGILAGTLARLDVPARRAVVFSGVTRNSLVVLPLVLALPAAFALASLVVVTQTLIELLLMVALVRLVTRWAPPRVRSGETATTGAQD